MKDIPIIRDSINVLSVENDSISTVVLKIINQPEAQNGFIESNYIPLISVIIAGFAFFVSWRVLAITKRHNKISIKPYLIFRINTGKSFNRIELYISNKGLGPCIIDKFDIKYNRQIYTQMSDVVKALKVKFNYSKKDFDPKYNSKVYPLKGYSILPEEKKILLKYLLVNKTESEAKKFFEEIKKIEFVYKFHDFYEHEFKKNRKQIKFSYENDFFIENSADEHEA